MTSAAPRPVDPAFPGIAREVVEAYRNAPDNVVAEILDGALVSNCLTHFRRRLLASRASSAAMSP